MDTVLLFIYIGFIGVLFFIITALWFAVYYFVIRKKFYIPINKDIQVMITKENRFELNFNDLKGARTFKYDGETYYNIVNCSIPNTRGKVLSLHNKGKPQPLEIKYNESKWLDNKSINSIMTNELIPKLLQPPDRLKDLLLFLSVIFSFLSLMVILFVALKLTGVIKGKPIQIQVIPMNTPPLR